MLHASTRQRKRVSICWVLRTSECVNSLSRVCLDLLVQPLGPFPVEDASCKLAPFAWERATDALPADPVSDLPRQPTPS